MKWWLNTPGAVEAKLADIAPATIGMSAHRSQAPANTLVPQPVIFFQARRGRLAAMDRHAELWIIAAVIVTIVDFAAAVLVLAKLADRRIERPVNAFGFSLSTLALATMLIAINIPVIIWFMQIWV